jgi:triosephosphate isomerase (TIM)
MPARYLIANWKMNLPAEGLESYLGAVGGVEAGDVNVVVAPPFPYLTRAAAGRLAVSAQNCADQKSGAFTGEVSVSMVAGCGARFVIIGHSERRSIYQETDATIARKLSLALDQGLTPVLCIGEDLAVRDAGKAMTFVAGQIEAVAVPQLERDAEVVVAYEPIWAIGTGRNATGAMCCDMAQAIREALGRCWPARYRDEAAVLYGGSVTPDNIPDLDANGRVDGYLVGGASLDSAKFLAILKGMGGG